MKSEVKIGNKKIGTGNPTYIIAEIGSNHNKNKKIAKKMIDEASEAGVDAVKFQTFKAEKLYSKKAPKFSKDTILPFDLIKSIELPREWHKELLEYAEAKGLQFLSSPFDYEAVDELDKIGVPAFKIASFEIVDLELLKYIAKKKKPILLSTGMANIEEIEEALEIIRKQGNNNIILLQCSSMYPAPVDILNLNAMDTMSKIFKIPIGYSDHTIGIHIPVAAVAKGATVIEKHFTLDRTMKGPDHHFAIEPSELKQMVSYIRDVEKAQGTGVKKVSKKEQEMFEKARRSIHAFKDIPKGTIITREMLIVKRPGYGIKPKFIDKLVGKKSKRNIKKEEWITWDMV
ncbi:MAG: N-acetylneuraminate synthase [Thermoplasmatales archaeon]|nr:MAG: N-acetylneuraminate synthase [Thermoplasmatales archaeon]